MQVLLATENLGKLKEFQELFGERITCLSAAGKPPLQIVEDGETYYENALKKAMGFYKAFGVPVLSDDSGLEVDALKGAPGVFSARFGGDVAWPDRWRLLHQKLAPFPKEAWQARFRCVLCYYDGTKPPVFFEGVAEGRIDEARGEKGFGYDPIFHSADLKKSFGEASAAEKHRYSHRAVAAREFLAWITRPQA